MYITLVFFTFIFNLLESIHEPTLSRQPLSFITEFNSLFAIEGLKLSEIEWSSVNAFRLNDLGIISKIIKAYAQYNTGPPQLSWGTENDNLFVS